MCIFYGLQYGGWPSLGVEAYMEADVGFYIYPMYPTLLSMGRRCGVSHLKGGAFFLPFILGFYMLPIYGCTVLCCPKCSFSVQRSCILRHQQGCTIFFKGVPKKTFLLFLHSPDIFLCKPGTECQIWKGGGDVDIVACSQNKPSVNESQRWEH